MILRFAFGVLLGILFFGGLWLTVRRLPTTRHPLGLTLSSLILRMGIVLGGFILVIDVRWQNAAATLAGFTAARLLFGLASRSPSCT
jgi:F1F0 ATPase subunit 2